MLNTFWIIPSTGIEDPPADCPVAYWAITVESITVSSSGSISVFEYVDYSYPVILGQAPPIVVYNGQPPPTSSGSVAAQLPNPYGQNCIKSISAFEVSIAVQPPPTFLPPATTYPTGSPPFGPGVCICDGCNVCDCSTCPGYPY
jgi:hypothetical protein